jgi:RHS repeat-associated protein
LRITDQVGSLRGLLDLGEHIVQSCTSFPYGDGATCSTPADQFFTGKPRDAETTLDYFGARYYNSTVGRWMSPDPSGLFYASPSNPQSFNLYTYVQNNPLTNIDPTGLDCIYINNDSGKLEGFNSGDCDNSTEDKANTGRYIDGTLTTITTTTGDANGRVTGYSGIGNDGATFLTGTFIPGPMNSPQPTAASGVLDLLTTTALGKLANFGNDLLFSPSNRPSPNLLLDTKNCGKGGDGSTNGPVNGPCAAHDSCYERAGLSADSNAGGMLTLEQAVAAQACNQMLYDSVRMNNNAPGSKAIQLWLTRGDTVPFGHLAPGTEAVP